MRIGLVVPHIFMQDALLPQVIFAPADLALSLANGLTTLGDEVTLYTPDTVSTKAHNKTVDLSQFRQELVERQTDYLGLLKSKPLTFITLARQAQTELIAQAYADANAGRLDIVHIYTNEEDIALPFAQFCRTPVVFTHHDPFNLTANYKNVFAKYKHLNWLSISLAQRQTMPKDTNWVGNIYHGIDARRFAANLQPQNDYLAYIGRIISPKGVHLAIAAMKHYNQTTQRPLKLKIAGKHYAEGTKDNYWQTKIEPELGDMIECMGFIKGDQARQDFLGNAAGLIIPSTFEEPFGMVMLEALACGTPLLGLDSGAIPEIITPGTGVVVSKTMVKAAGHQRPRLDESATAMALALAIPALLKINRQGCRNHFEQYFTLDHMVQAHHTVYSSLSAGKA